MHRRQASLSTLLLLSKSGLSETESDHLHDHSIGNNYPRQYTAGANSSPSIETLAFEDEQETLRDTHALCREYLIHSLDLTGLDLSRRGPRELSIGTGLSTTVDFITPSLLLVPFGELSSLLRQWNFLSTRTESFSQLSLQMPMERRPWWWW